jgi:hypothetical protein
MQQQMAMPPAPAGAAAAAPPAAGITTEQIQKVRTAHFLLGFPAPEEDGSFSGCWGWFDQILDLSALLFRARLGVLVLFLFWG